jgi:ATP-dependent helicase/nuclease subunit B
MRPLVYLGASLAVGPEDDGLAGWEMAFLHHYSQHAPVLLIVPDIVAGIRECPLLAAAWPELAGANRDVAIATARTQSGDRCATSGTARNRLDNSLEEESIAIARQVLQWRHAGIDSIALVALDRLTARRVRALLERAQIAVRDETGWKLSTTSAAAAVMRWYDLVADDLYWRDLLDWRSRASRWQGGRTRRRRFLPSRKQSARVAPCRAHERFAVRWPRFPTRLQPARVKSWR